MTGDQWRDGLRDPAPQFRWVVMDAGDAAEGTPPDAVWASLHDGPALRDNYRLVYQNGPIQVYRR